MSPNQYILNEKDHQPSANLSLGVKTGNLTYYTQFCCKKGQTQDLQSPKVCRSRSGKLQDLAGPGRTWQTPGPGGYRELAVVCFA